ncbi:MAG: cysteine desulfurase NifS [Spirochaetes bacterium]|nr:cysteine desulfurase NifS [Spirochaetota bacterium]
MEKIIYLDNNATTMVDPLVLEEMLPFLRERYGNPSSMYDLGGEVAKDIAKARIQVAELLGAEHEREIVFTSCGTESDNMAISGVLPQNGDKKHIITSRVEHPAVLNLCKKLERDGYRITYIPVDREGLLNIDKLKESADNDTAIVSIMLANNETGVIFPVEEIGSFLKEKGILFHIDAVQAVGKIPIDVKKLNCDMLSISGHKFHSPKGIGALYIKTGTKIQPLLHGGHQEKGMRPGTENAAGIVGMGKAAELALKSLEREHEIQKLRDSLENGILEKFPNCSLNGAKNRRVPNTCNVGFEYIEGESILLYLNEKNIAASSGSACSSGSLEPSHVLRAMGVPFTSAHGSIRFSLSRFTAKDEIDYTLSVLPEIINRLLEISPFWDSKNKKPTGIRF